MSIVVLKLPEVNRNTEERPSHCPYCKGETFQELQSSLPREWLSVLEEIRDLLEFLPPDGNKKLYALWKQVSDRRSKPHRTRLALEQLRDLLLRLSQELQRYCVCQSEPQVPGANNSTLILQSAIHLWYGHCFDSLLNLDRIYL